MINKETLNCSLTRKELVRYKLTSKFGSRRRWGTLTSKTRLAYAGKILFVFKFTERIDNRETAMPPIDQQMAGELVYYSLLVTKAASLKFHYSVELSQEWSNSDTIASGQDTIQFV